MKNKRMIVNLLANIISFTINMAIGFLLTPFIVNKLGREAYGFIGLANNFVSYASVLTVALNSVAGRFITIKIHQKKLNEANIYFNSVLIANTIMSTVLALFSAGIIINLERIINISQNLMIDVKVTFAIVFLNFVITLITSIFNVATFVRNRLDLSAIASIKANILRGIVLISLFSLLKPRVYYISISAVVMSAVIAIYNTNYTKKLLSEIKIKTQYFKLNAVKELLSLGIWNSVNNLSQILLNGLDLLIANLLVSSQAMGDLSIAKSIPMIISSFLGTIGGVYAPKFTILYAEKNIDGLVDEIKLSMKTIGVILTVPLVGFMVFGIDFYKLWLPTVPSDEILKIQILSLLTFMPTFISVFIFTLYHINTITNKLKVPVLLTFGISILSTITVIILLKTTSIGVYAIAGVSSTFMLLRVIFFVPIYAAYSLNVKWTTFYSPMIKGTLTFSIISLVFWLGHKLVYISTWSDLMFSGIIFGIIGYILNFFIILSKAERQNIISNIKRKLLRKKGNN